MRTTTKKTRRTALGIVGVAAVSLTGTLATAGPAAAAEVTQRVSVNSAEQQAFGDSPAISATGRFVAFDSFADNLGAGSRGNQVFVRDSATGTTSVVSVRTGGAFAGAGSSNASISDDGRFVAFESRANDLVNGDTNNALDVFRHDRLTKTTERVSLAGSGAQGNGISMNASISGDGRWVAFESAASNLVSGDTNAVKDVFVRDTALDVTIRVSRTNTNGQANGASEKPSINFNGSRIAFQSEASNLVTGDTAGATDVFVRKLSGGTTRVSVSSFGAQGNSFSIEPSINADGTAVAFTSRATTLVPRDTNGRDDVFHHDVDTKRTTRIAALSNGEPNGSTREPSISADGRKVAFKSNASNLAFNDFNGQIQDVFVADLDQAAGFQNKVVSVANSGQASNGLSTAAALSDDARVVAFESTATNLVSGDSNFLADVFTRTLQ